MRFSSELNRFLLLVPFQKELKPLSWALILVLWLLTSVSEQGRDQVKLKSVTPKTVMVHDFPILGAESTTLFPMFFPLSGKPFHLSSTYLIIFVLKIPIQVPPLTYSILWSPFPPVVYIRDCTIEPVIETLTLYCVLLFHVCWSYLSVRKFTTGRECVWNFYNIYIS